MKYGNSKELKWKTWDNFKNKAMTSDFLKNLQAAADTGTFNSEAAKKINAINEIAEEKAAFIKKVVDYKPNYVEERLSELSGEAVPVSEEEAATLNFAYEKKMAEIREQDAVNLQIATLIDIEDIVKASIADMFSFITELDMEFEKQFADENPIFSDLKNKITELKSKYKYK